MKTSILEEAERVAAARWAATAPPDGAGRYAHGRHGETGPHQAAAGPADHHDPLLLAGQVARPRPRDHAGDLALRRAGEEAWLIRQMLRHDGLTIAALTIISMILLVGLILLAPYLL